MSSSPLRPVLLVNPRICSPKNARLPLSLLALGAVLEGKREYALVDGNLDPGAAGTVLAHLDRAPHSLVGLTVMPGPQVGPAIAISEAVRARFPDVPIAWGGYFPSLYPEAALNSTYVDVVVRGAGEETLLEVLARVDDGSAAGGRGRLELSGVRGVTWKRDEAIVHEADRPWREPDGFPPLPIDRLGDVSPYLARTFLGRRTGVHQAALGCRYRCSFCGVVSMFGGKTLLSGPARMLAAVEELRDRHGADAIQFYDNNFFDSEESSVPILEALSRAGLPYWCYARPDTLAGFSSRTWELARRSGLRMAYVGAEAGSDRALRAMHKGTKVEQTFEVARRSREYGVIPEFSFVLGGPEDPEGEVENTLRFVRKLKAIHPECEVILYFYTPTPQRDPDRARRTLDGRVVWGGYDALYYFGADRSSRRERRPRTEQLLAEHFFTTFPQLQGVRFSHAWAGMIDTCTRFTAFWHRAMGDKVVAVQGYTGLGVGASRFGARVALELLEGLDTPRTQLELVRRRPLPFPPEPLRLPLIEITRRSTLRAQVDGGRRNLWLRSLDRFGLGFDS